MAAVSHSKCLAEQTELWIMESMILNTGSHKEPEVNTTLQDDDDVWVITTGNDGAPLCIHVEKGMNLLKVLYNTLRSSYL